MGIMNRRNATLGWLVWEVGKRMAKKKAKQAIPGTVGDSARPNRSAILALVLLAAAAAWVWWRLNEEDDDLQPNPE